MHGGQHENDTGASDLIAGPSEAMTWSRRGLFSERPLAGATPWSSTISRHAIAVLAIAVALVASKAAAAFLHVDPFVSLFLCAIMVVAWFGGFGPGLLATVLGFLVFDYYLVPPISGFTA